MRGLLCSSFDINCCFHFNGSAHLTFRTQPSGSEFGSENQLIGREKWIGLIFYRTVIPQTENLTPMYSREPYQIFGIGLFRFWEKCFSSTCIPKPNSLPERWARNARCSEPILAYWRAMMTIISLN